MKKKMKRFESGGEIEFETAQGPNKSIGDDVRARAMAAMEKGNSDESAAPKATPKATPKAASKPYSPKSQPESDREENSAWMRQFRKDEAKAASKAASKPIPVAKVNSEKTGFEQKMSKALGYKSGGKVSSASSRADGCATKGKTKGRMV